MRVLSAEAMARVDRAAIEDIGIPGPVLMENAALGVVEALAESFPRARTVTLVCGPGNNGGDGLAVARHLEARGYRTHLWLVRGHREVGGDAARQLEICRRLGLVVRELIPDAPDAAEAADLLEQAVADAAAADVLVDGLFGTGLSRALEGHFRELVEGLDALPPGRPARIAVDLPSGLSGSTGEIFGPHLRADVTVTFAALKTAHVLEPAAERCGEVVVTDLGFPPELIETTVATLDEPGLHLLTGDELAAYLPPREPDSHKGDYGHLLLVAGSAGKSGAAVLAARGAVRGGAGLVTVAVPEPLLAVVDAGSLESMTLPCSTQAGPAGTLGPAAVEEILAAADGKDALALGPGCGTAGDTPATLRRIALECPLPLVLDADGLNAFAGRAEELQQRTAETILTPHPGELARLLDCTTAQVQEDRLTAVRRGAALTGAVTVLKGRHTLIADRSEEIFLNPTGNPGLAGGGSGDVLTGLLGALLAQGYEALAAAQLGVYLHGLAGDLLAGEAAAFGPLAAGDLPGALTAARRRIRGG